MITTFLVNVSTNDNEDKLYSLDELREITEVTDITQNCWLCVHKSDNLIVNFLLVQFAESEIDGVNTKVSVIFEGSGPSESLREARHIYWGPDGKGYTFYLPADAVIEALNKLKEYFDFD